MFPQGYGNPNIQLTHNMEMELTKVAKNIAYNNNTTFDYVYKLLQEEMNTHGRNGVLRRYNINTRK